MKSILTTITAITSLAVMSCAGQPSPTGPTAAVIDKALLDSATVLVIDSTEHRFDFMPGAHQMLVYHDSIVIVSRWIQAISPSSKTGTFYLTIYADENPDSARMKLVKVTTEISEETEI